MVNTMRADEMKNNDTQIRVSYQSHLGLGRFKKGLNKLVALSSALTMTALLFTQASHAEGEQPASQMIPVAGHSLHTMSVGEGEFTVIFESGFGNDLSHWRKVAPAISQSAKVVSYSRAGSGKSDAVAKARTLTESTADLNGLIEKAALQPPFVLVGHSYGSHIVRSYAAQHPENVAGLVLVDPANEAFILGLKAIDKSGTEAFMEVYKKMVPERLKAESKILMAIDERGTLPDFGALPDVPTVVLTSMVQEHPQFIIHSPEGKRLWRRLHSELAMNFSRAMHITTMNSGHNIAVQEPALVIEAIERVMAQAKALANKKTSDAGA